MIKAAVKRFIIVLMLGLSPWALKAVDLPEEMKILADSAQGLLGNSRLPALNAQWMEIARELNDTTQMEAAYDNLISHYYRLGDIDSLKEATYEYMDWCTRYNKPDMRYMYWRQYIQRVTEKVCRKRLLPKLPVYIKMLNRLKANMGWHAVKCVSDIITGYLPIMWKFV